MTTTPAAGTAPDTVPAEMAAQDGGPPGATEWRPRFSGLEMAFLVAVPLAWAISRLAIVPFVAFYAAADAIVGLATGILVKEANDGADTAAGAQALWDNFITDDLLFGLGGTAAFRQVGASTAVVVLTGLSAIVVFHPPPLGPNGLLCFAAAVVLLARGGSTRNGDMSAAM